MRTSVWLALVLLATGVVLADDAAPPAPDPNAPVTDAARPAPDPNAPVTDAARPAPDPNTPVTDATDQAAEQPKAEPGAEEKSGDEAAGAAEEKKDQGPKAISGMSILGNQEAPKSLVIVPWKTSEIGDAFGFTTMLDDSRQPVDREVFLRELSYYEVRSKTTP